MFYCTEILLQITSKTYALFLLAEYGFMHSQQNIRALLLCLPPSLLNNWQLLQQYHILDKNTAARLHASKTEEEEKCDYWSHCIQNPYHGHPQLVLGF